VQQLRQQHRLRLMAMKTPGEWRYSLKPLRHESSTASSLSTEAKALFARIKAEDPSPLEFRFHSDTPEITTRHLAAAERVFGNPRINQEGCSCYIDVVDPVLSNCPAGLR
jgi:hypothetical protein